MTGGGLEIELALLDRVATVARAPGRDRLVTVPCALAAVQG
jgi:hypothetical protein